MNQIIIRLIKVKSFSDPIYLKSIDMFPEYVRRDNKAAFYASSQKLTGQYTIFKHNKNHKKILQINIFI